MHAPGTNAARLVPRLSRFTNAINLGGKAITNVGLGMGGQRR
jgi:hypothetical protein